MRKLPMKTQALCATIFAKRTCKGTQETGEFSAANNGHRAIIMSVCEGLTLTSLLLTVAKQSRGAAPKLEA